MSRETIDMSPQLLQYVLDCGVREPELLKRLREETAQLPQRSMQIAPEQGQFMALLIKLLGARRVIEVGTFTGYSALVMALAMVGEGRTGREPGGAGRIVCCDLSEEWTNIARRYWQQAGVEAMMDLRLQPASDTLDSLITEGEADSYDFAFIDADKESYDAYYERCLVLLRPGGLIAVDNVLWGGSVIDPEKNDADTKAIRAFNSARHRDDRVDLSLVPIGDGVTLLRKR